MLTKVIKFSAEWCSPCRKFSPIFHEVEKMDEFKNIQFIDFDVDEEHNDQMKNYVHKFQIRNIPTILLLNENDVLIHRLVGSLPKDNFIAELKNAL